MDPSELQEKPESTVGQRPERSRPRKTADEESPTPFIREGGYEVDSEEERRAPAEDEPPPPRAR